MFNKCWYPMKTGTCKEFKNSNQKQNSKSNIGQSINHSKNRKFKMKIRFNKNPTVCQNKNTMLKLKTLKMILK